MSKHFAWKAAIAATRSAQIDAPVPKLGRSLRVGLALLTAVMIYAYAALADKPAADVAIGSIDDAVSLALERSPILRAAEARKRASRGERAQAGVLPNPEASVEVENAAGSGAYRGFKSAEITFGVAQKIELGGKSSSRQQIATAGVGSSDAEYEAARLDLVRDVKRLYAETLAAERNMELATEQRRLADDIVRVIQERVAVGKEPLVNLRKAEIVRANMLIAAERATSAYHSSLRSMALLIGLETPQLSVNRDPRWFEDIGERPTERQSQSTANSNPSYTRWESEIARGRAALAYEKSQSVPDVTVGAGVRHFRDTEDTALVFGVTVPIPVFNRNRGAIDRAREELVRTEAQAQQDRRALSVALQDAEARLDLAWVEADSMRRVVVSAAEQSFGFAREGYSAGKFAFIDVLDAQRTYFESRAKLNDALKEVHLQRAEVERLRGAPIGASVGRVTP